MSTPSETISTETSHVPCPAAKRAIRAEASGASEVTTSGPLAGQRREPLGQRLGVLLVGGDHEPAGVRVVAGADPLQPQHRVAQHVRHPVAVGLERGAQAARRLGGGQDDAEVGAAAAAVAHPLHVAVVEVERHRAADAVEQRVGVAVGVVGLRDAVGVVGDPRDRRVVRAERRAREQELEARGAERLRPCCVPHAACVAHVVRLVGDQQRRHLRGAAARARRARPRPSGRSRRRRGGRAAPARRRWAGWARGRCRSAPRRAAHWRAMCVVGATTATRATRPSLSIRCATWRPNVVLPAAGVAEARNASRAWAKTAAAASCCHARSGRSAGQDGRVKRALPFQGPTRVPEARKRC